MIRVGIVEDKRDLAEDLVRRVQMSEEFSVVCVCGNGQELLERLKVSSEVDVLLMDIEMPVMNGVDATAEVTRLYPHIGVVICSVYQDEASIIQSILAGATGYLLKDESPGTIHQAIRQCLTGGSPLNPVVARKTLRMLSAGRTREEKVNQYGLTRREVEVLELLATGKTYEQIADTLHISTGTIRKHVENLYRKLEVSNKVDAIRKLKP